MYFVLKTKNRRDGMTWYASTCGSPVCGLTQRPGAAHRFNCHSAAEIGQRRFDVSWPGRFKIVARVKARKPARTTPPPIPHTPNDFTGF